MARSASIVVLLASVASASIAATTARAQEDGCDDELTQGPREITPSVGANGVTPDAPVIVLYSPGYFGDEGPGDPPETLIQLGACPADAICGVGCALEDTSPVPGSVQVIGDRLYFVPDEPLDARRPYVGIARGLDEDIPFAFCTGTTEDRDAPSPPVFIDAQPDDTTASCMLPEGGRRIGLRYEPSVDDGPLGSIEYLLYLTRGAGVNAPQLRDRVRNNSADEALLRLLLSPEESAEPICVRVYAVDGVGNVSEPTPEECVDPITTASFQPLCAALPPGRPGARGALVLAGVGLALAFAGLRRGRRG